MHIRSNKIAISGDLGSGKTVVGHLLADMAHTRLISIGELQRSIASKLNMTTLELNKYAETHPEIDREIDSRFQNFKNTPDALVIDSRMAWHLLPDCFKVYLEVDIRTAAKRVLYDKARNGEPSYQSVESAIVDLRARRESEDKRFLKQYAVDCAQLSNFDLVVNTSDSSPEEIAAFIFKTFKAWSGGSHIHRLWYPPRILYPTQNITMLRKEDLEPLIHSIKHGGFDAHYPVDILKHKELLYIWNGHKRVSASIHCQLVLIPIEIVASDHTDILPGLSVDTFIKDSVNPSWIYDWEDCNGFAFKFYPHP